MKPKNINIGYNIPYGTKSHILYESRHEEKGYLIERRVYKVPKDRWHPEGYKYSLVLIKDEKRILGYDNHERKGHHIHIKNKEMKYNFIDENNLMKDFEKDVQNIIGDKDES